MAITNEYTLKISTKQAQKNLDEVNESLELQKDLVTRLQDELNDLERELGNMSSKDATRMKKTKEAIKLKKEEIKEERSGLKQVRADRKAANDQLKKSKKEAADFGGIMGLIDKQTGGAVSSFTNFTGSIGNATKGMKALRVAWIATGIGAFVVLITSLVAAFTQSEEGQEKLQRGLAAMGAVVKNVMDAFADLGQAIMDAITAPQKAWASFKSGFKKFISDPIGTVKGAYNDAKEAAKDFIDETIKEVKAIDKITKARQQAHHIERDLIVERAEANQKINDIRLEAEKRDKYTAGERVALLKKAQKIEEDITNKQIKAKQLLIDAQVQEMAQGKNTIQDKDKLAKLQAELINLDTKKLRSQRLLQTQITTAQNQEKAEKQKKIDEANAEIEEEKKKEEKRLQDIQTIRDTHEQMVKEQEAIKEEEKAIIKKEKALKELEELNATEEQKAAIISYWDKKIQEGKNKDAANEEVRDKAVQSAKLGMAKQGMALIGEIAGKGSAVGKAMAIGQATISGIEGVQNAYSTAQKSPITVAFPAYPYLQAGLAGAFSALQIKKILSTKADGKGSTPSPRISGGGAASVTASVPTLPPAFNIVGDSGTNQLANVIGQQTQQPIQAFVVASDVSTAQELDRNIITGASLG
jgi:hypothetical protein